MHKVVEGLVLRFCQKFSTDIVVRQHPMNFGSTERAQRLYFAGQYHAVHI
jgi:hypothetical protein